MFYYIVCVDAEEREQEIRKFNVQDFRNIKSVLPTWQL